jgi:DNA-binding transcriptional ArsR family regulator
MSTEPLVPDEQTRRELRGLAHPLRLRLLDFLTDGPATSSILARRLGESSGATSYHLRALERAGWIEEDVARGKGRERWWQRVPKPPRLIPTGADDAEGRALEATFWGMLVERDDALTRRFFERLPELERRWRETATIVHWTLRMTDAEAQQFAQQIAKLAYDYQRYRRAASPDTAPYTVSMRILPLRAEDDAEPPAPGAA